MWTHKQTRNTCECAPCAEAGCVYNGNGTEPVKANQEGPIERKVHVGVKSGESEYCIIEPVCGGTRTIGGNNPLTKGKKIQQCSRVRQGLPPPPPVGLTPSPQGRLKWSPPPPGGRKMSYSFGYSGPYSNTASQVSHLNKILCISSAEMWCSLNSPQCSSFRFLFVV